MKVRLSLRDLALAVAVRYMYQSHLQNSRELGQIPLDLDALRSASTTHLYTSSQDFCALKERLDTPMCMHTHEPTPHMTRTLILL